MSFSFSPLRYPGGKNCIFPFVSSLIEENGLAGCTYIEPYAGGAGLALRLLFEEFAEKVVINDLDPFVYSFWKICVEQPDRLIGWIEKTPISISVWKKCKDVIRHSDCTDVFELATSFFYLNRTNVSGVLSGGVIGGLRQAGAYKIDARFNKASLIHTIEKITRFSARIQVTSLDGVDLIESFNKRRNDTFIYMDPPYYEKGANLYLNAFKQSDHEKLSDTVATLATPWLLSYDKHSFVQSLYSQFEMRAYKLQHSTSNKVGNEVLIFSNNIKFNKSIRRLNQVRVL